MFGFSNDTCACLKLVVYVCISIFCKHAKTVLTLIKVNGNNPPMAIIAPNTPATHAFESCLPRYVNSSGNSPPRLRQNGIINLWSTSRVKVVQMCRSWSKDAGTGIFIKL